MSKSKTPQEQLSDELVQLIGREIQNGLQRYEQAMKSLSDAYGRALESNANILLEQLEIEKAVRQRQIAELQAELAGLKGKPQAAQEGGRLQ